MTPATTTRRTEPPAWSWASLRDDSRQFIVVLIVLAVALLAGLLLKGFTEGQTRVVRGGGVSAAVPADWVYQPGAGDLLFVVNDPRQPGHRYLVTRVADAPRGLTAVVDTHAGAKSQLLPGYQSISREAVRIGERTGEAVTFAYVLQRDGQIPRVIQARDLYLQSGEQILVVSNEGSPDRFEAGLAAFEQFARSVGS